MYVIEAMKSASGMIRDISQRVTVAYRNYQVGRKKQQEKNNNKKTQEIPS